MPLLTATEVTYTYPDGRHALQGVNLKIYPGEKVGLLGLNGAGKSTLLLCLAGVLWPRGEITVQGVSLSRQTRRQIGPKVGLLFQDPNDQLFMTTVFEDVAFGPQNLGLPLNQVEERVSQALAMVGAADFTQRFTHHLSFGEKKRVALATILAMEPDLLLLDEPTSNLDPKRRRELLDIIAQRPQAMLIATHDLAMAQAVCSRIIILEQGLVVADGSTDLLNDESLLQKHELI